MTVRARLTALYAGLFLAAGAVLLGTSYWLVSRHFRRTMTDAVADDALADLRGQYLLALLGATLVSVALGWVVAGRVLRPLARIGDTARRISQDNLDERIAMEGPRDELRSLAATFDGMLDRLAASFDAQRRFVANASHELRTPLSVIRTEVDVALADPHASVDELRAMGEAVREACAQCEELLDGLLTLAQTQAGVIKRQDVDLLAALNAAVAIISGEAVSRSVSVRVAAPSAVAVPGDRRLLERLVANLIENGVRHNACEGGWVVASLSLVDGRARLVVENSGETMSAETAERLFEPFQRLERGHGVSGAGLGLSIVRSVAEAHGGSVALAPRGDGGLAVTVELPGARPARAGDARATGSPSLART